MTPLDIPLVGLVALFRMLVFEPHSVASSSMAPTLEIGETFIVSKSAYGYSRFSLPIGRMLPAFTVGRSAPGRGDIVVFRTPFDLSVSYVARVIGIAGDRVQVIGGITHLNGTALARKPAGLYTDKAGDYRDIPVFIETMPGGPDYRVMEMGSTQADDTPVFTVPAGHFFVIGDNRDNSNDSRFGVGFVPYDNIVGKVVFKVSRSDSAITTRPVE